MSYNNNLSFFSGFGCVVLNEYPWWLWTKKKTKKMSKKANLWRIYDRALNLQKWNLWASCSSISIRANLPIKPLLLFLFEFASRLNKVSLHSRIRLDLVDPVFISQTDFNFSFFLILHFSIWFSNCVRFGVEYILLLLGGKKGVLGLNITCYTSHVIHLSFVTSFNPIVLIPYLTSDLIINAPHSVVARTNVNIFIASSKHMVFILIFYFLSWFLIGIISSLMCQGAAQLSPLSETTYQIHSIQQKNHSFIKSSNI